MRKQEFKFGLQSPCSEPAAGTFARKTLVLVPKCFSPGPVCSQCNSKKSGPLVPLSALLLLLNLQRVHPQGGHLASGRNDQNVVLSGRRALKILLGEGHTIHGSQSYYGVGTPAGLAKVGTGRRHADRNHTASSIYLPATQCQGPRQCLGHLESSWRQRPGPGPEAWLTNNAMPPLT